MRTRTALACALLLTLAACGDDDAASTTDAPATTAPATTQAPATTAPPATTTTAAPTTTTTAAPTTTTTTLPADAHPVWGVSWSAFLPPEGATAVYEVVTFDGRTIRLPGTLERNVEWRDATWDRFLIGQLEIGQDGGAAYFDLSDPWVIRFGGVENTTATTDFLQSEWFDEPLEFDFNLLPGETITIESVINGDYGGFEMTMGFEADVTWVSEAETIEVPAGTYEAGHFTMAVGGEFIGGVMASDVWTDIQDFFIRWTEPPGFRDAVLAEPWDR